MDAGQSNLSCVNALYSHLIYYKMMILRSQVFKDIGMRALFATDDADARLQLSYDQNQHKNSNGDKGGKSAGSDIEINTR